MPCNLFVWEIAFDRADSASDQSQQRSGQRIVRRLFCLKRHSTCQSRPPFPFQYRSSFSTLRLFSVFLCFSVFFCGLFSAVFFCFSSLPPVLLWLCVRLCFSVFFCGLCFCVSVFVCGLFVCVFLCCILACFLVLCFSVACSFCGPRRAIVVVPSSRPSAASRRIDDDDDHQPAHRSRASDLTMWAASSTAGIPPSVRPERRAQADSFFADEAQAADRHQERARSHHDRERRRSLMPSRPTRIMHGA